MPDHRQAQPGLRTRLFAHCCRQLALALLSTLAISACDSDRVENRGSTETENSKVIFDVSMLSYYERPIFDVKLNGIDIGAAGAPPHGDHAGVVSGVAVPLGPQTVTWRLGGPKGMDGNGETVTATNQPVLEHPDPKLTYLGIHIYPDNSVDVIPVAYWPRNSEKGDVFLRTWEAKHDQQ